MEDNPHRKSRSRVRWTLGSIMMVVAAFALIFAVVRPIMVPAPKPIEVIGIDFVLETTQRSDGQVVSGFAPKIVTTRTAMPTLKALK